jgi:hypothetical protein
MSKNEKPKHSLLRKNFVTMLKIYRVILNDKIFNYDDNFFCKKLKDFFPWILYGAIGAEY